LRRHSSQLRLAARAPQGRVSGLRSASVLRRSVHSKAAHGSSPSVVQHDVVVVGGGAAGLSVSHQLRRAMKGLDVAIVEPSSKHYYQPGWTMVGGGVINKRETERYILFIFIYFYFTCFI
jgi:sulfide:quinone oxidoreductase